MNQVFDELINPYIDPREELGYKTTFFELTPKDLLYCMINESEKTFKIGMEVSAKVTRNLSSGDRNKMNSRVLCRLDNGLEASIKQ